MKHLTLILLFIPLAAVFAQSQSGPCTESAIKQGGLPVSDDAFSYMPPYGNPVVGKPEIKAANEKSFSERTHITHSWVGEHRIVSTSSGDMAYEYGTMHTGYDTTEKDDPGHHEFEAVMLKVYKAKNGVCQQVALTMQPLEEQGKK